MRIDKQAPDDAVLTELGERLAGMRLERNLTQAQLAEQAGVSKRTVERLESGAPTQLPGFIRICRVLDIIDRFEALAPEAQPSPIMQLRMQGKRRQRASVSHNGKALSKKWQWGDE